MTQYVLFHDKCYDGIFSAWVAWKALGNKTKFIPVRYQEDPPELEANSSVLIVDFSYPIAVLKEIETQAKEVMVIDHHKTAMNQLSTFAAAIFDMEQCGASLTWKYFADQGLLQKEMPQILSYVQDRDLWQNQKPFTYQINVAIRREIDLNAPVPEQIQECDRLVKNFEVEVYRQIGQPIFEERMECVRQKALSHVWAEIGGYRIPAVEADRYYSDIANLLCEMYKEFPFSACWRQQNGKIVWDLRSVGEFDVSVVAQQYGGGGHQNAAGFSETDDSIQLFSAKDH